MNERIQAIAEHCDFYVGNEHYDKSHEEQQRLFMEKFAELIIKECIDICNEEKADYTKHKKWAYGEEKDIYNEGEAACDTIKRIMKKRFGVEK